MGWVAARRASSSHPGFLPQLLVLCSTTLRPFNCLWPPAELRSDISDLSALRTPLTHGASWKYFHATYSCSSRLALLYLLVYLISRQRAVSYSGKSVQTGVRGPPGVLERLRVSCLKSRVDEWDSTACMTPGLSRSFLT